jgi:DNA-binding response OmpR family regulator
LGIVDRDSALIIGLSNRAQKLGWEQTILPASISPRALAKLELDALSVDLAIIDERRWAWLRSLCQLRPDLAIVVCTGRSSVRQRVLALRLGADDWLTKPCHPDELVARLEAASCQGRRRRRRRLDPIKIGELEIRPDQYQAFVNGRSLALTSREYHLLELLALGGGEIQERERIYDALWGGELARNGRSVDVCVHKLRRKLELASPDRQYIYTHYGVGYRLAAESGDSPPRSRAAETQLPGDHGPSADDEPSPTALAA